MKIANVVNEVFMFIFITLLFGKNTRVNWTKGVIAAINALIAANTMIILMLLLVRNSMLSFIDKSVL